MSDGEAALLQRYARSSDADAFRELFEAHQHMVYAACRRVLGSREDAMDAAQTCFLKLAQNAGRLRAPIAGWLHRVAVNTSINVLRRDASRRVREKAAAGLRPAADPAWEDLKPEIDRAIAALPARLRVPLVLHYLEGRKQVDIAGQLGISQPAVSKRLGVATEALRKGLTRAGVAVSAAALVPLVSANVAEAAPPALAAALGKMAVAGVGTSGAAVGTAAVGTAAVGTAVSAGGAGALKAALVGALAVGSLAVGTVAVRMARSDEAPPVPVVQRAAAAEPVAANEATEARDLPADAVERIFSAVRFNNLDEVRSLLDAGVDPNVRSPTGLPLLHLAAGRQRERITALLLDRGADAAARDDRGWTAMHRVARLGSAEMVAFLAERGLSVDVTDSHGNTPLHEAAQADTAASVTVLLGLGAEADARASSGLTPLNHAAAAGHEEIVKLLLAAGADPNATYGRGHTILGRAASGGRTRCVEMLIEAGADVNHASDLAQWTALHGAARGGDRATVEVLIEAGAAVNVVDNGGRTPYDVAAANGHTETAELLADHGAEMTIHAAAGLGDLDRVEEMLAADPGLLEDTGGAADTPLEVAVQAGQLNVVEFLLERGADPDVGRDRHEAPLHTAAKSRKRDALRILKVLLEHGADLDARNFASETPLHVAVWQTRPKFVAALLEAGASPNARANHGKTPLHHATVHRRVVRMLLKAGADPNAGDAQGLTPLETCGTGRARAIMLAGGAVETILTAARAGDLAKVRRFLAEDAAAVTETDSAGNTPLHRAASKGQAAAVELLLAAGADVDALNDRGAAPLHQAAAAGDAATVAALLAAGADPSTADNDGATPLHVAAEQGQAELAEAIAVAGADLNVTNHNGRTPLDAADEKEHAAVSDLLRRHGARPGLICAARDADLAAVKALLADDPLLADPDDKDGRTALYWAARGGHAEVVAALLAAGADPNAMDRWGNTPLTTAISNDHPQTARLLRDHGGIE